MRLVGIWLRQGARPCKRNAEMGVFSGYGFVVFATTDEASAAIRGLQATGFYAAPAKANANGR